MSGAHKPHGPNCDGCLMLKITAERDVARTQRDALQAQVDAVKAIYLPHRASLPGGFEDACVCLGCNMARALGGTGDES